MFLFRCKANPAALSFIAKRKALIAKKRPAMRIVGMFDRPEDTLFLTLAHSRYEFNRTVLVTLSVKVNLLKHKLRLTMGLE